MFQYWRERSFHLGDILSITTRRLLSPRHMDGVYDILNYLTGDDLCTHQLPRAARQCTPLLLAQHPFLQTIAVPKHLSGTDAWYAWRDEQVERYGEQHLLQPLPPAQRCIRDPIEELKELVTDQKIVVIETNRALWEL